MFLPPYKAILEGLGIDAEELEGTVTIPVDLFRALISALALSEDVDGDAYLTNYPDVVEAIERGDVPSPQLHFACKGYFEGRRTFTEDVDQLCFPQTNLNGVERVDTGLSNSGAKDHYIVQHRFEKPLPSLSADRNVAAWLRFLAKIRRDQA
jgi:hypothetical protein